MPRLSTALGLMMTLGLVAACGEEEAPEVAEETSAIEPATEDAAEAVGEAAEETAEAAEETAEAAGETIEEAAEETAEATGDAVEATEDAAEETVEATEQAADEAAEETAEVVEDVEAEVEEPAEDADVLAEAGGGEATELTTDVESDGEPVTAEVGGETTEDETEVAAAETTDAEADAAPAAAETEEAPAAGGTVHEVRMLNADPDNPGERQVFEPAVIQIEPGDTVRWISEDRGHNSVVNEDMMPEGGATWEGAINEDVEATFDTEGTYGYHCTPHRSAGMVGLVLVGDASANFEEARSERQRGVAAQRYEEYFQEAEEMISGDGS